MAGEEEGGRKECEGEKLPEIDPLVEKLLNSLALISSSHAHPEKLEAPRWPTLHPRTRPSHQ